LQNHGLSRQGFTLVELSIVLVVIGLLIGGVLIGQSMIESTKITAQVRQFQQFDMAVSAFKRKFGGLPADNTIFNLSIGINPVRKGNGDGIVDNLATPCCQWHDGSELANFWFQLTYTNMLQDGKEYRISFNGSRICGGDIVPMAKLIAGKHTTWYTNSTSDNLAIEAYGIQSTGKNYYTIFQSCTNSSSNSNTANSVAPKDLAAMDNKMDDGNGSTGKVVARSSRTNLFDPSLDTSTCVDAFGNYRMPTTVRAEPECTPRIEMLSQVGE
jgi:prepilin-type N-terminal cleavage/methylation domain-containing protein